MCCQHWMVDQSDQRAVQRYVGSRQVPHLLLMLFPIKNPAIAGGAVLLFLFAAVTASQIRNPLERTSQRNAYLTLY